jgi:hypothetical protein
LQRFEHGRKITLSLVEVKRELSLRHLAIELFDTVPDGPSCITDRRVIRRSIE